jgi:hypothetical protein
MWLAFGIGTTLLLAVPAFGAEAVRLFDGRTLDGWEGDGKWWWVEDGAITGGSRTEMLPHNVFLATRRPYEDFELRLKIRITGEGFVNSGIQIRSTRVAGSPTMIGYQLDVGQSPFDPSKSAWGVLWDELRRSKILAGPADSKAVLARIRSDGWNEYRIRAEGRHIRSWVNGVPTVDYQEQDPEIPQTGLIAIQVHGDGKTIVQVKDVTLEVL